MTDHPAPLLVLDVDGVLNRWSQKPAPLLCEPECVRALNMILDETSAVIVVSSSLRGVVHSGEMTVAGLSYLLRSHGIRGEVVGVTDEDGENTTRGILISRWLFKYRPWAKCVILDDEDDGISARELNFVQTNGSVGLTEADAERAIEMLRR